MKKLAHYFLLPLFAVHAVATFAQRPERPAPRFTLTISGGDMDSLGRRVVKLTETNISSGVLQEGVCMPPIFDVNIKVSIVYNGLPLEMDESRPAVQHIKRDNEGEGHCPGKVFVHEAKPGGGPEGTFEDSLDVSRLYDMSKPGTYEITVTKETFPHDVIKSVTVRSNTLTVVVPEPEPGPPK
jgi:hypothetical protein